MFDDLGKLTEFKDFRFHDIETIYQSIKLNMAPMFVVSIIVAMILTLINIYLQTLKTITNDKREISIVDFVAILREKWKFFFILMFTPVFISGLEALLGTASQEMIQNIGEPNASLYDGWKKQLEMMMEKEEYSLWDMNVFEFVLDFIDYTIVMAIQPAVIFYVEHAYASALVLRFLFLGLADMVAPIAIACVLFDKTQQYFYTWLRAMLVAYLLIPGFLLAHLLTEEIYQAMLLSTNYNWIFPLLLLVAGLKTIAFASVAFFLFRII